jgi:sugar lactone lactonase YvrE
VVTPAPSPPANLSPPVISGVAQEGRQLSASTGTWSNEPTGFTYEWLRCDSLGEACVAISGGNASTYTLTKEDVGATVRVAVVASNGAGSSPPVLSLPSEVVTPAPSPPANLSPPVISGVAQKGQQLSASTGAWSNEPTSFTYKWLRCDTTGEACKAITGANASTRTLTEADVGATLRVSVVASNAAGPSAPALSQPSEVIAATAAVSHYEYVFNDGPVSVYDIDKSFKLIESFTLPGTNKGVRGVAVSPSTHMMFVSYGGNGGGAGTGSVLAYDLLSKEDKWSVNLATGVDSLAVSNDGKLLYVPDGAESSDGNWYILSTTDGSVVGKIETAGTGPHDGVLSADGKTLQLGDRDYTKLPIYNTQTGEVEKEVGPLVGGVRPNTIDGSDSLSFTTANGFDGFQVSSIATGKVLYTESFGQCSGPFTTCSHGVSLSPDSKQVDVIDTTHKAVQVWDVHGVREGVAPTHLAEVPVAGLEGNAEGCAYDCEREGWVAHTLDGRYVLVGDSGDVIETATQTVVAKISNLLNSRMYLEIDWSNGVPIASSGRQGIGYSG